MINRNLKNQVIQNHGGIVSFKNVQQKLESLKTVEEIYTEALKMINQFINIENASIYIKKGSTLNQIIKIGNSSLGKILLFSFSLNSAYILAISFLLSKSISLLFLPRDFLKGLYMSMALIN